MLFSMYSPLGVGGATQKDTIPVKAPFQDIPAHIKKPCAIISCENAQKTFLKNYSFRQPFVGSKKRRKRETFQTNSIPILVSKGA